MNTDPVDFIEVVGDILVEVNERGMWSAICICGAPCSSPDKHVIYSWLSHHQTTCQNRRVNS